jgi:hypothetical protein
MPAVELQKLLTKLVDAAHIQQPSRANSNNIKKKNDRDERSIRKQSHTWGDGTEEGMGEGRSDLLAGFL